jgi:hypothetical protein
MNKYKMIKPESDYCSFFGFFVMLCYLHVGDTKSPTTHVPNYYDLNS